MYLDTDCVLALLKPDDWLKEHVTSRVRGKRGLCTSVLTAIECKLVISREMGREDMHDITPAIKALGVRLLPLDDRTLLLSNELLKKYGFLGVFDSIHVATAMKYEKTILSTDHIFPLLDEVRSEDPRGKATGA